MPAIRALILVLVVVFAPSVAAAPCSGFTDVDDSSLFCPNVDWVNNRAITTGATSCGGTPPTYCPGDPVSRLSMAAFLNRLGTALTPKTVATEAQGGALNLTGNPVVCQTAGEPIVGFPRSFLASGFIAAKGDSNEDVLVQFVRSSDGGLSWVPMNQFGSTLSLRLPVWNNTTVISSPQAAAGFALNVGTSYQFGLQISRLGAFANVTSFHCHLIVELRNRQGSTFPHDPDEKGAALPVH